MIAGNRYWRTVLVTGGAGFIGSHVVDYLTKIGKEVHIADRFSYAGKVRNIASVLPEGRIWYGDLKEKDFCQKLAGYPWDVVIHMAGNTHVDRAIKDPVGFTMDNVYATNQLLHEFRRGGLGFPQKMILYSTDEVFGSTPKGEIFDEDAPFNPSNAYSASKVGIEGLFKSYVTTHQAPLVLVRPCNTYGPRQHPEKAIPRFVSQVIQGFPMTVHNDGQGARDWLWHEDHARGIVAIIEHGDVQTSYNLAAGDEHTDIELAERIGKLIGQDYKVEFTKGRPGHDRRYWMNASKLRGLGWKPEMSFDEGLKRTVDWTLANKDWWEHDYVPLKMLANI